MPLARSPAICARRYPWDDRIMPMNYERAFAARPDVYAAWRQLAGAVSEHMDGRRYELATLAAAQRLRSSYCSLAHAKVLVERFDEPVLDILRDRAGTLSEVDVAVMELAEQVAEDATRTDAARARLKELGLTDEEIADVVLDGLGVLPDAAYAELEPALRDALVVGRPIEGS
jgi:alkylhydroperoxidase family enzyme